MSEHVRKLKLVRFNVTDIHHASVEAIQMFLHRLLSLSGGH
jgi:hypothetical protein